MAFTVGSAPLGSDGEAGPAGLGWARVSDLTGAGGRGSLLVGTWPQCALTGKPLTL